MINPPPFIHVPSFSKYLSLEERIYHQKNIATGRLIRAILMTVSIITAGGGNSNQAQTVPQGIVAEIRPAGRQLVLELSREGGRRGQTGPLQIVLSLGSESEMREVGQATLSSWPQPAVSLLLNGLSWNSATENTYLLTIYETLSDNANQGRGTVRRLILYRHATLRPNSDPPPTTVLSLSPPASRSTKKNLQINTQVAPAAEGQAETTPRYQNFTPPPPVQLQAQLLSSPGSPAAAILSVELYAERPLTKATFEISLRNHRASKPVNLERQLNLTFDLPENFAEGDSEPVVHYRLVDRDRLTLLEGDLPVTTLLEGEDVGLRDLQTDQPSYRAGDQVRITLIIEGSSGQGINIELGVRDEKGQYFHRDQRLLPAGNQDQAPTFNFALPPSIKGPVTIEYQLHDPRQGRLYDAGQRELVIREDR
jgi:hypothetical protein